MSVYLLLFWEFLKVGLFAIGGGLTTLPFIYEMADKYEWMDTATIADMLAIAQSAPGPIGVNIATYVGIHVAGVPGGLIAAGALVLPSLVIISMIAKFLANYDQNPYVLSVFSGLRPAVVGLIAFAALELFKISLLNLEGFALSGSLGDLFVWPAIILFLLLLVCTNRFPKHPVFYIIIAAIVGILFKF